MGNIEAVASTFLFIDGVWLLTMAIVNILKIGLGQVDTQLIGLRARFLACNGFLSRT